MKIRNPQGYQTCLHSRKRKQAPWRVSSGCENRARLFTGKHYELPNSTVCMTCPFYCKDKSSSSRGRDG
ncbi:hypothetical protein [uncultured Oscillibacter sp.]|jgi:hypothetical protein|uniref:hypothetical protein n=1 Tax=uncultured Oscillibacter sp. TaxID=876091 RepID=UPI0013716AE5|nr:hypothetical protein [uncultured Oscillibacter sp.]